MQEHFTFPNKFGQPTATEEIKVTPRFTAETVEGRPKLTGIYHLAVTVNFNKEQIENHEVGEAVVIDDLDMNGNNGYFEYAVPFNIDFPPEAEDPVNVKALNPSYEINNHQLSILWDVTCTYEEAGIQQQVEEAQANAAQSKNEKVAEDSGETTKVSQQQEEAQQKQVAANVTEPQSEEVTESPRETQEDSQNQVAQTEEVVDHEEENEPISQTAEVAIGTVSTSAGDEVLDFIAELEDGISATSFRLNDIFV